MSKNVPVTGSPEEPRKPVEHRPPTASTIKQLYGTAFRCGELTCMKPLYRVNDETGEFILNSRVAHIHARSEGGPRWDPDMSEEVNRSAENLLPLCEEHAFEVDATPQHFSANALREWKSAQLTECIQMQKSWPLTDAEAAEVVEQSFDAHAVGIATASAATILAAARAVGLLVETCRQQRRRPAQMATAWRAWRDQVAWSMPVWDSNGNRLPVEPPLVDTRVREAQLLQALADVVAVLEPIAAEAIAEHHAVRAADEKLAPWCDWVETATNAVVTAAARWPGNPPVDDDEVLPVAISELQRASAALSSAWRRQPAEQPPERPIPVEPVESEEHRQLREHRELLETARPWARVNHRPYDPELYARLIQTASYALGVPPIPSALSFDLAATAGLAADVARNADDDTYRSLITAAVQQHPLAIAVHLVRRLMFVAEETGREELATQARERAVTLLREQTWEDPQAWADNKHQMKALFGMTASISSDTEVRTAIATALANNPELLPLMLCAIAQWTEHLDSRTWQRKGIGTTLDALPAWFPTEEIVTEIKKQMPDLQPAHDEDGDNQLDEAHRLAALVLHLTHQERSDN